MYVKLLEYETYFVVKYDKDALDLRTHDYIKQLPKSERKWNFSEYSWTVDIKHLPAIKQMAYTFSDEEEEQGEKEYREFILQFEDPL